MVDLKHYEVWFLTGSQHLYGPEALKKVDKDSQAIVAGLSKSLAHPGNRSLQAGSHDSGSNFQRLPRSKQLAVMHRCYCMDAYILPGKNVDRRSQSAPEATARPSHAIRQRHSVGSIDMNFMNLNQTAHGGREFGFITARMKKPRKVVVGFWEEDSCRRKIGIWTRAAAAWADAQGMKIARFGDNMSSVAVTEGDKVEAELRFGYSVNGYGVGDLVAVIKKVGDVEIESLLSTYEKEYEVVASMRRGGKERQSLREAARIELGLTKFLGEDNFKAFTTTFEDLHGLEQLPGLSVQRLMSQGFGFGAEGDWKTAALLRSVKTMSAGLPGGTSFMEDYTYHLDPSRKQVLGAHMLEICQSIAADKPKLEIHPLSIGGKADPPRLVFNVPGGAAINATLVDMGNRFRSIVNEVETIPPEKPLPKLPVARASWIPKPNFETAVTAWILAGGAHHTVFSQSITTEYLEDFAEIAGIEMLVIDDTTTVSDFKKELRWNELYYRQ